MQKKKSCNVINRNQVIAILGLWNNMPTFNINFLFNIILLQKKKKITGEEKKAGKGLIINHSS